MIVLQLQLHDCALTLRPIDAKISRHPIRSTPSSAGRVAFPNFSRLEVSQCVTRASRDRNSEVQNIHSSAIEVVVDDEGEDYDGVDGFLSESGFRGREGEKDYDRDPEFAEIIGTSLDDPDKARSKV